MTYLFVYGTLKSGHRNNHYLDGQRFMREAETKPKYRLFENGSFPMLVSDKRNGYAVSGEIWRVDEDALVEIDMHEVSYDRRLVEIQGVKNDVYAYFYLFNTGPHQECYGHWG